MLNLKKHQKIFLFAILVVASISLFDILSMQSNVFGTPEKYLLGSYTDGWWGLFFNFSTILIILVSLSYYWFGKHDKSESIALGISSYLLWTYFVIADILFFWMRRVPLPNELPWLDKQLVVGNISRFLGFENVNPISMYLTAILGLISVYYLCKLLVQKL